MAVPNAEAVSPFPPPPKYYENFEPLLNKNWKPPAPPKPVVGSYVVFGTLYDTDFAPQPPSTALEAAGITVPAGGSPVAALRQLNRMLPDEYLTLVELLINRPVLCMSEDHRVHILKIDEQREKVEGIIRSMYDCLSRFRPYQAKRALIATLRAQIEVRRKQAEALRDCRTKAQSLIASTSAEFAKATQALQAAAAKNPSEHPLVAASSKPGESTDKRKLEDANRKSEEEGGNAIKQNPFYQSYLKLETAAEKENKRARLDNLMKTLDALKDEAVASQAAQ